MGSISKGWGVSLRATCNRLQLVKILRDRMPELSVDMGMIIVLPERSWTDIRLQFSPNARITVIAMIVPVVLVFI